MRLLTACPWRPGLTFPESSSQARLFLHLDSLGPLAIELTRICWIAFILSFLLPTAGVAPMWAESAFNRLAAGASTKTQAIIHSLNMDLQGAMISIEVYTTQVRLPLGYLALSYP